MVLDGKKERILAPLPIFDDAALLRFCEENSIKESHAFTIQKYLIQNTACSSLQSLSTEQLNLPANLLRRLQTVFAVTTSKVVQVLRSKDGTIKLLVELQDGKQVESVLMRYENRRKLNNKSKKAEAEEVPADDHDDAASQCGRLAWRHRQRHAEDTSGRARTAKRISAAPG